MADVQKRTQALNYISALLGSVVSFSAVAVLVGKLGCASCSRDVSSLIGVGVVLGVGVFLVGLGILRIRRGSTTTVRTAVAWVAGTLIALTFLSPGISSA